MLQPGDRIGRYEIQRRLGRGGMGTVYVAHDPVLGRLVAIKLFAGDLDAADAAEKFAREARAAAALNHANIVTIHDFGEFDSQPFIVMEYIQGETVARLIRKKAELPLSDRLRMLEELCGGVAYAHGFEVIHRDIKPANLMLDRANRLKILDFGIARILGTSMSKGTALVGTPGYMAPEQIRGGDIDRRSDLFSIGVVAYELLSYAEAFPGDSVPAITHRILTEEPVSLSELVVDIPPALVGVIERALRKEPAARFPDAAALGAALAEQRREIDGDPRYKTLLPTLSHPQTKSEGSTRDSDSKPHSSGTGQTTPSVESPARREELMRRRSERIEQALSRARTLLAEGRLSEAQEACLEALTLDETQAALQVETEINAAIVRRRVRELTASGRDAIARGALTEVEETLRQIRELDPQAARPLERDLRVKRNEQAVAQEVAEALRQALDRGAAALERGDADAAWSAARQALLLAPASEDAKRLEAEARRRMDVEAGVSETVALSDAPTVIGREPDPSGEVAPTVIAPAARPAPPVTRVSAGPTPPVPPKDAVPRKPAGPPPEYHSKPTSPAFAQAWPVLQEKASLVARAVVALLTVTVPRWASRCADAISIGIARARARMSAVRPSTRSATGTDFFAANRTVIAWTAGGLVLVAIIAASAFTFRKPAPTPAPVVHYGTLTIDAVPWATVAAIVAQDGTKHPLPEQPSTPVSMRLPVGVYRITMAGPPPESATQEVTVTVEDGKEAAQDVRFPTLTAADYFEPYLAPQAPAGPADTAGAPPVETVRAQAPEGSR